jgi:hypothetical protein
VGQFDQTARLVTKTDGAAFFGWAFSCCTPPPRITFLDWDDTRRLVSPGEPDRTNDLVALFRDEEHPGRQTWLVAEIEEEPDPGILYRMAHYELLLAREVNPGCDRAGPAVGSLVLNLTGSLRSARLEWSWSGGAYGTRLAPFVVDVARQDAVATLERIERGEVGLTVLPFLALMDGGGTVEFIDRWKRVAEKEPDESRRKLYRDSAPIMAELTNQQVNWLRGTEGWMERKSQIIEGWKREGAEEGALLSMRRAVLRLIRVRLGEPVSESIRLAVEGTNDLPTLDLWLDAAGTASTLGELRQAMKMEP